MKYETCLLLFALTLTLTSVSAQEINSKTKRLTFGLGTSYLTVRDISSSPLRYNGLGVQGQVGYEWENSSHLQQVSLNFQTTGLNNSISYSSKIRAYVGDLSYAYLHRLNSSKSTSWRLGGTLDIWANVRPNQQRDNNPMSYDAGSSLGLVTQLTKRIKLSAKTLNLDFSLGIPVLSYVMRPSYGIPYPEDYLENGVYNPKDEGLAGPFLSSGKFVTFDQFFRVQSHIGLTYPVSHRKAIRLGYNWDYYAIQSVKKVQLADHSLLFSLLLKLKK